MNKAVLDSAVKLAVTRDSLSTTATISEMLNC